jgi:Fic family protein
MKMPKRPPSYDSIWKNLIADSKRLELVLSPKLTGPEKEKYLHWDKLQYYPPPAGLTHEEWWYLIKSERRSLYKQAPLKDTRGDPFKYLIVDPIPEGLHRIDQMAGRLIPLPDQITDPDVRDRYRIGSLIQEAITSSQLEGAVTTREVAKEMLQSGRRPRDRSERMILNNFRTMKRIGNLKGQPLSSALVFELHKLVTESTLDQDAAAGRLRTKDEKIILGDLYNEVFHEPPAATELESRMQAMCDFANDQSPAGFMHPVIRSIILHFWLAYDHPFVDGNGRTARALFYWSMLRHGYWWCEFISMSQIIIAAPAQYVRAFLYTETDDNDLTYFIRYHLDIVLRAIEELQEYVERKSKQLEALEERLRGAEILNPRQRALIDHALRHPAQKYTIKAHQMRHGVVYQTARTDLLDLEKRGLLKSKKVRRQLVFTPADDLKAKLSTV